MVTVSLGMKNSKIAAKRGLKSSSSAAFFLLRILLKPSVYIVIKVNSQPVMVVGGAILEMMF